MINENQSYIIPLNNELPSQFSDRLGILYSSKVSQENKKKGGQFFTPLNIANLMASFSELNSDTIRILDPGCGTLVLSCTLIENIVKTKLSIRNIYLTVYETDLELIPFLQIAIEYLEKWVFDNNLIIRIELFVEDYISKNAFYLHDSENLISPKIEQYDIIISNPPYFKLSSDDKRVKAAKSIINGHANIYVIFMFLSAKLLKPNGELIFITPRSFAAGGYFKLFRKQFFSIINLEKVHLFVSRKDTFKRDKVLQETVIIKGTKGKRIPNEEIIISSSNGLLDIEKLKEKKYPANYIIDFSTSEKILHIPTTAYEEQVLDIFKNWSNNLGDYNIKVSTGPVVSFRAQPYIKDEYKNGSVKLTPLFWLHNVKQMVLEWPLYRKNKGQYIIIEHNSIPILVPNKNYIFLRRFSSKDDKRRLIAAPYFCNSISSDYIGIENKLNYIYRVKEHLNRNEVIGICALLNSDLFDTFFRIFNGNVNVSATELREITFPPLEIIKEIGKKIIISNNYYVENTNNIVNNYLLLPIEYE